MRSLAVLVSLVLLATIASSANDQGRDATDALTTWVESNVQRLGGNVIAVLPFPYSDGIKSVEGSLLSERVTTALAEGGVVRVVERAVLDKVIDEQKLSLSGLTDPASSVKVGKLLGAKGILSGTVTDLGENIEVHARLLNVETGEVVATVECTALKIIKTFINPMWSQIERIKKENKSFAVRFWADRGDGATEIPSYRVGDFVTFRFEVDRDCYMTIFDFTTSGSIHVLFPNAFTRDNKVKAGRTYTFPDAQAGFRIRVKDPPGVERLKVFATTKNIPLFQEDYAQEKFRSVTPDSYSVTRDLEAVVSSLDENTWAESNLEIRVEQVLRGKQ